MDEVVEGSVATVPGERRYARSPVDWLIDAARRSPAPAWAIYGAVALTLLAVEIAVTWRDGTFPSRFGLIHVLLPVYAMAVLPILHFFDNLAARAIASARPLLTVDERGYEDLRHRLTSRPVVPTLLAGVGGLLALVGLTIIQPSDTHSVLHIMVTPLATAVEWAFQFLVWLGVGIVSFDIARRLRLIDEVYSRHVRISLFTPGPLYAFSRLAAAMVIVTLAITAVATLAVSELAGTAQWAIAAGVPSALAAMAFVAPLWGAHRRMAQEKARQMDAIGSRIDKTVLMLRDRVDTSDLGGMDMLKDSLDGLIVARNELASISTWPWQRETLGGVVTAVIAPLFIWLVTQALERAALI